ncbi:hypothetical protein DFH08DRAFT_936699 [Mycena albidolilacea]|uniref:Uncharacterized protein n=1 Tax=Mycena albidolilacea TaxID=1033008 RepID=A0AAD7ETC5_9AGAR|nr:hypothetical protein DFH08DRAFT_936699 [Mycena albidolilacea]
MELYFSQSGGVISKVGAIRGVRHSTKDFQPMSAEKVAELQDLLAQLQKLNLQGSSPDLDDQLAAAVNTAKAQIQWHSRKPGQAENSTQDGRHGLLENHQTPLLIANSDLQRRQLP